MIMDPGHTCYSHLVYWDNAKTKSSVIYWYRALPGAQFFPAPHIFSSERFDDVHYWTPGAGEDWATPSTWYNGRPPALFTGQTFCGELDWFTNGCPSDAPPLERTPDGLPACCFSGSGSGLPPFEPVACGDCTIMPAVWRLRLMGQFFDSVCIRCGDLIGQDVFLIYFPFGTLLPWGEVSNGCEWIANGPPMWCPGSSGSWFWRLTANLVAGKWQVGLFAGGQPTVMILGATVLFADFACVGDNLFTFDNFANAVCECDVCQLLLSPS